MDAQLSRLVNSSKWPASGYLLRLSKMFLATLDKLNLKPILAQRAVSCGRVGTAIDFLCTSGKKLVVVELKCGFDEGIKTSNGKMLRHLKVQDCLYARHMVQLAVTFAMFEREGLNLEKFGVDDLQGLLLYVGDEGCRVFKLSESWKKRGRVLMKLL